MLQHLGKTKYIQPGHKYEDKYMEDIKDYTILQEKRQGWKGWQGMQYEKNQTIQKQAMV